ncbi:hypothetical protein JR316_0010814 [Psilocybe cubensis]|uniref:Uncharacterized protein n=2 Tax=Psilocybe cubensis TaxID=181762 RepID=A0ACB8GMG8_PSICU|nr:hypothetical protein JR316_0010814 [Psilocybe cubensis]KAH9476898.1 hypothetical protein JR316_0010814 [Psilocybe cubensis]
MSKSSGHHRATISSPSSGSNGVLPLLFAGSGTAFALLLLFAAYHLLRHIVSTCRRRRRHRGPASQSAGIKRDLRQNTYGRLASRVGHPASDDDGESITQDKDVRRASAIANSGSEDGDPAAPPLALQIYVNRLEERVQHLERVLEARGATSAMNPISLVVAARARAPSTSQGLFEMDTDMETATGTGTAGGDSQQFDAAATTTIARAHANPFLQDEEESRFRRDGLPPSPEPERTNDSPLSYTTNTQRGSQAESVNSVGGRSSPPEYRSREVSLRSNAN